jgi:hypothetical protein
LRVACRARLLQPPATFAARVGSPDYFPRYNFARPSAQPLNNCPPRAHCTKGQYALGWSQHNLQKNVLFEQPRSSVPRTGDVLQTASMRYQVPADQEPTDQTIRLETLNALATGHRPPARFGWPTGKWTMSLTKHFWLGSLTSLIAMAAVNAPASA